MRRYLTTALLCCFFITLSLTAWAQEANISDFKYMGTVNTGLAKDTDFLILKLSPEIINTFSTGMKDLRIYAGDKELGYANITLNKGLGQDAVNKEGNLEILNKGSIDGKYSFSVAIPGELQGRPIYYQIRLAAEEYLIKAKVYGSNDNRSWKYLKEQTLYGLNGLFNDILLEGIDYDYLKFEYELSASKNLEPREVKFYSREIVNNSTLFSLIEKGEGAPLEYEITQDKNETHILLDLAKEHVYHQRLLIDTGDRNFYRQVKVETSKDQKEWTFVKETFIYSGSEIDDRKLEVTYPLAEEQFLRLSILNKDNEPLNIKAVQVFQVPVFVLVNTTGLADIAQLQAYWGNNFLEKPDYDIVELKPVFWQKDYPVIKMNDLKPNPKFMERKDYLPFTERYKWLMPFSLVLVVILALIFLSRTLREMKKE